MHVTITYICKCDYANDDINLHTLDLINWVFWGFFVLKIELGAFTLHAELDPSLPPFFFFSFETQSH